MMYEKVARVLMLRDPECDSQGEDWQSEKCDVSMMEGVKVALALNKLDQAIKWVTTYGESIFICKTQLIVTVIFSSPTMVRGIIIATLITQGSCR